MRRGNLMEFLQCTIFTQRIPLVPPSSPVRVALRRIAPPLFRSVTRPHSVDALRRESREHRWPLPYCWSEGSPHDERWVRSQITLLPSGDKSPHVDDAIPAAGDAVPRGWGAPLREAPRRPPLEALLITQQHLTKRFVGR